MTITKTSQGYNFFTSIGRDYVVKMHYIGYSLTESKRRFTQLVREQKEFLKSIGK